ncbi:MAG TPA: Mur ligase domain-containing protein [Aggregatilineales bacterium]|nr:Mur ligase domain-containing protein [Aggregatilineales bacterium]
MLDPALFDRVHIIGVGGAGMSAIARILLESGSHVSGSDRAANDLTRALARDGATIYEGHAAANVQGAKVVLISSAIKADNPEVIAARAQGIPILDRRDSFRYLLPGKTQIAVAGTKGKTTTAALIVHLLRELGRDPSYIVGGTMLNTGDNAHVGQGDAFVVEADEYGYMFLGLTPRIAVITNIEHDHPDMFPTLEDMVAAFRQFLALLPHDGIYISGVDREAQRLGAELELAGREVVEVIYAEDMPGLKDYLPISLMGAHNLINAVLATITVVAYDRIGKKDYDSHDAIHDILLALTSFKGTSRRFEIMGKTTNNVTIVSDYGHHPMAIRATLEAAKARYPDTPIWAVWQPHTYSRTKALADDFVRAFKGSAHALVMDIYPAREGPIPSTPTESELAERIRATGHPDARRSGNIEATAALLEREAGSGDLVIFFSAGDAPRVGEILLKKAVHE